jgi:hypothetical protein
MPGRTEKAPDQVVVLYVHPSIWRPHENAALNNLTPQIQFYARALLTEFHNRHIGIPPRLAAGLARILLDPEALAKAGSPWQEFLNRLVYELSLNAGNSKAAPARPLGALQGVSFSAAPAYTIRRIVMPLVNRTCWVRGETLLYSEDEQIPNTVAAGYLREYENNMLETLRKLANQHSEDHSLDLFWKECAFTLAHYSNSPSAEQTLPAPDPLAAGFLLRLDDLPTSTKEYQHLDRIHFRRYKHHTRQRREEGLAGIVQTRSLDDLQRILIGEFVNPEPLLIDRILNTGYLVNERLPKREKLRDAIFIGLLPPNPQGRPAVDFLRSCWLNSMAVMYQALVKNYLHDSLILWVEGAAFDRFHVSVFSVAEMRIFLDRHARISPQQSSAYRAGFLQFTHWLPGFIDARKAGEYLPLNGQKRDAPEWVSQVWRSEFHQKRARVTPSGRGQPRQTVEMVGRLDHLVAQFAYAHIMTFLSTAYGPAGQSVEEQDPTGPAQRLAGIFDVAGHKGCYPSVHWYDPQSFLRPAAGLPYGSFYSALRRQKYYWGEAVQPGDFHAAATALEQGWLEEWIQEMQSE